MRYFLISFSPAIVDPSILVPRRSKEFTLSRRQITTTRRFSQAQYPSTVAQKAKCMRDTLNTNYQGERGQRLT
jgi:hypothetical protein